MKNMIRLISVVSLMGALFSGYYSVQGLASGTCPTGGCELLLGIPTCVYGLVMYLVILAASIVAMKKP